MDIKEFDALLHDAEVRMKRLKALYEQWFQGIERIEPQVARKELERAFLLLNKNKPRNTAARFRLQQLVARYSIYTTLWGRVARQIEEGTYERDIRRAQRIRGMPAERAAAKEYELDLEDVELDDDPFGLDDIASMLSSLDAKPAAPAVAPRPALSAFSPFASKAGAQTAKQPAAPAGATPAPPATSTFKKPAVATFGKPKVTPDSSGTRAAPGPAGAPRDPAPPSSPAATPPRPLAGVPSPGSSAASGARATPVAPAPRGPRPAVAIPSAARVPLPPPRRPQPSGEDTHLKGLYDSYVDARRRNNERVDNLAYDKVAASVQQMASKLREKHGNKKIDFEVVVQNGKVGIKPKIG